MVENGDGGPHDAGERPPPSPAELDGADAGRLHGHRAATGLTPLVWATVVIVVVLAVLLWQLS